MKRLSCALLAVSLSLPLAAQVTPSRWGSTLGFGFGSVDRSTLAVHFSIPIFTRATVGNARIRMVLGYNSAFWGAVSPGNFGWTLLEPYGGLATSHNVDDQYCGWWNNNTGQYDQWYNLVYDQFTFTEPDGTTPSGSTATSEYLELGGGQRQRGDEYDCPAISPGGSVLVPDGKGFTIEVYNVGEASAYAHVFDSRGDEVDGLFRDPNGNQVTVTSSGGLTSYHDPLGNDPSGNPALTESGAGNESSPVVFTYTGPGGALETITERFAAISVTNPGCGTWSGTPELPIELDLADGGKYVFGYDLNGRVNSVTLPTGAVIHYAYTIDCTDFGNSALTRWDSVNGSSKGWSWQRTQQGGGAVQTVETTPDANDGVFSFAAPYWPGEGGALTAAAFYQGSHTGGSELESIAYSNTLTDNYVTGQGLTTELFESGQPKLWRQEIFSFDDFGNSLYDYSYDWGTCYSCGDILRNVTTTYTSPATGMDLPSQVTVSPSTGAGGQIAQTNFSYQSGTGNLLSETDSTSATTSLTKSFTYNPNGTVATATGANGEVTNYTYGTAVGATGCGLFPTLIASADKPAIQSNANWDCVGGVPLSQTGANSDTTSIVYTDPLWRPTQVTAPDGGVTNLSYSPTSVERSMTFNSGASTADRLTTLDALGRPTLQQKRQGPGSPNFDSVQTAFDAMDRPVTVSMPYTGAQGAGAPSGTAVTTTYYDALSRVIKVVDGGTGEADTAYAGNDVLRTVLGTPGVSPNVARQAEFDGLGRLSSVCELTATLAGRGACVQTIAQTGYWTKYTRNPLGEITEVVQNAQGSPTQTRYYNFDWLGRLTSESNPESGQTFYYYDGDATCGNGNGDLLRRVDANGNTTCFVHDSLHRLTSVTYPSGPNAAATPTKTFDWDSAPGQSPAHAVGRLVKAMTGSVSNPTTTVAFSYDIAGRTTDVYESTPHSNGWYTVAAGYYPNGAVSSLGFNGLDFTYGADPEGRMGGVTDTISGKGLETGVAYNPASQVTGLTLGSVDLDKDAWSYDANTGRMTTYSATIARTAHSTTLNWNTNGSLAQMKTPGSLSQNCSYTQDDLGRIASASCGTNEPNLTFSFDPFGNLTVGGAPAGLVTSPVYSNNVIAQSGGVTMTSDADGNLEGDPAIPQDRVNVFDAEGHAVTFENAAVVYDALGRAVEVNGSWEYVYGPGGRKLAVMQGQTQVRADVPLPGGDEAVYAGASLAYYRHGDWEGSARLSSTPNSTIYSARAFTPYGAVYDESGAGSDRDFTGAKQDVALNKYDFLLREYEPVMGRWFTPDPAGLAAVNPNNPQTWNRFAYVGGKPLAFADPLGLEPCNTASLRKDDGQHRVGGPYSGDDDGAAGSPGDCDGGVQQCSLDGVDMECNLLLEFTGLEGGLGGGESIGGIAQCAWADCMGAGAIFDSNNNIRAWQWKDKGGPGPCSIKNGAFTCESDPDWGWQPDPSHPGSQPGCGALNFGCQFFSGFVNFFLNERPSGIAQMALGEAGARAAVGGTAGVGATASATSGAAVAAFQRIAARASVLSAVQAGFATNPALWIGVQQFAQGALAPAAAAWTYAGGAGVASRSATSSWGTLFGGPW